MTTAQERAEILDHDTDRITAAITQAVRRAIWDHYRTGDPIAIWRDGRVVIVPPEAIAALMGEAAPASMHASDQARAP